ncbi:MAG TPA: pyridoxal-phosphate dependent enzyme [Blastocatellia bacterium]|nr:pyridoxal-phosphate dependent enzyme [Blastocatellia bacterium]
MRARLLAVIIRRMERPTIVDVLDAHGIIQRYLPRTHLTNYPALDNLVRAKVLVKHENQQPVGAFKVRGGINLMSRLSEAERERGVISASTGNHGLSVAYAAHLFGVKARIAVPEKANPLKVAAIRNLGADVIPYGVDFDDARGHAELLAEKEGFRYIHSGNEPLLIAGVGTIALEILEESPHLEAIIVPVGGGSGAAGACIVAKALDPRIRVIGVQSERAPAAFKSWKFRTLVEDKMETAAEGLATRVAFALPQQIMWELLDDFVLVSEEEISNAIALYIEKAHTLAEGAGAASLAALVKLREHLAGRTVALVLSGGNITIEQLKAVLGSR